MVTIRLFNIQTTAVIDFISELFNDKAVFYTHLKNSGALLYSKNDIIVRVADYSMYHKEDMNDMLDRCILLNTYLGEYFSALRVISNYQIFYGVHHYSDKLDCLTIYNDYDRFYKIYPLLINEWAKVYTDAAQKLKDERAIGVDSLSNNVYVYNYIYTQLAENLKKQVNK